MAKTFLRWQCFRSFAILGNAGGIRLYDVFSSIIQGGNEKDKAGNLKPQIIKVTIRDFRGT